MRVICVSSGSPVNVMPWASLPWQSIQWRPYWPWQSGSSWSPAARMCYPSQGPPHEPHECMSVCMPDILSAWGVVEAEVEYHIDHFRWNIAHYHMQSVMQSGFFTGIKLAVIRQYRVGTDGCTDARLTDTPTHWRQAPGARRQAHALTLVHQCERHMIL